MTKSITSFAVKKQFQKLFKNILNLSAVFAFVLTLVSLFQIQPISVNAQVSIVEMKPGQTKTFNVAYQNQGDEALFKGGQLRIFVGKELVINPASLKDNFNNAGSFAVSPSLITTTNPIWGAVINYLPKSANNATAPSGTAGPADVEIPLNQSGIFSFEATLKSDVVSRFPVGTTISPATNTEGVRGRLESTGFGNVAGEISIKILAADACPNGGINAPTCTCATGQTEVTGQCTDVVDIANVGTCTPAGQNITIGQTATCTFNLTAGSTGNRFTLPTGNVVGSIATATGTSPSCTIINNNTATVALQCAGIPSIGATAGTRDVLVKVGTDTPVAKGNVNLTNATTCPSDSNGTFPNCTCREGKTYNSTSNTCVCPSGQGVVNGNCASCPSGATGTPTSCSCPNGQTYNSSNNTCTTTSCTNKATNPPACDQFPNIAKPDTDTNDNDNVGGDNEPQFTSISFNPNPGRISQPITVTTSGLVNFFNDRPYVGPCTTFISGNGFTFSKGTSAVNGVCTQDFAANEVPTNAGNYVAYTVVPGPDNQTLTTPSAPIQFIGETFVTPRTGGVNNALIGLGLAAIGGGVAILVINKRKKMKVE